MSTRASIKAFLAKARAALAAAPPKRPVPLTFVVGNESADLDSLCSALLLAYFHTYAPPTERAAVSGGNQSADSLHVPVCHLRRQDLALRPEFAAVLRAADVRSEDVLTLEDVLPRDLAGDRGLQPEETRWLLVDHNAMTGPLSRAFGARVVGCVDHHADEDAVPRDAEIRVIEESGSCASLVLEHCAGAWNALGAGGGGDRDGVAEGALIDAQLARLALAPILIDTTNLRDESKTTAHDERAVALAEAKIRAYADATGDDVEQYDRDAYFKRISALKEDIADMSFRDVFRKDYKEWEVDDLVLGTSSVPQGFDYLVDAKAGGDTAAFLSELGSWGAEKNMDLVVVMTTFNDEDGRFSRELLVWARTDKGARAAKLFAENNQESLQLDTWGAGKLDQDDGTDRASRATTGWCRCWRQGALEHSRKQIAPMLRDALSEVSGTA
ncbi:exopolyphosphatase-like protein [Xylariaceae sp. FL0594]|nr:exopolyphosphatase-like protein [Xylariaceae sp. FL0594]